MDKKNSGILICYENEDGKCNHSLLEGDCSDECGTIIGGYDNDTDENLSASEAAYFLKAVEAITGDLG